MGSANPQPLTHRVDATLRGKQLLDGVRTLVIGLSGGSDSTALLYVLHYLRNRFDIQLVVAHLHHGLRGREADRDAAFVAELAGALGLPLASAKVDVRARARAESQSPEEAARRARHIFFRDVCRRRHAQAVALAHTADDQAETLLLKLCRGAGPEGLGGMAYRNNVSGLTLIRPLLDERRDTLRAFLSSHGLSWREDRSNTDRQYLRNRVRHDVLPVLQTQLNPGIVDTLCRTAQWMRDENHWMQSGAEALRPAVKTADPTELKRQPMAALPPAIQRRIVRQWVREASGGAVELNAHETEQLLELMANGGGTRRLLPTAGGEIRVEYDRVRYRHRKTPAPPLPAIELSEGEQVWPAWGLRTRLIQTTGYRKSPPGRPGDLPAEAYLRADRIQQPLILRPPRPGDRIQPTGLKGTRRLKELFIDTKAPARLRPRIPVLTHGQQVVWVPGYRVDRQYAVPDRKSPSWRVQLEPR